ncbi:MAG: hypothetical protein AMXMBFR84_49420 [Candidatus Hydrogenedentota bacterium]
MSRMLVAVMLLFVTALPSGADSARECDVVVVGATPGGIAAAVTAARLGQNVVLIEYRSHVGGLSASGLGKSDIVVGGAVGGIWTEFKKRIHDHYVAAYGADSEAVKICKAGTFYEPHVAESVFMDMLSDAGVDLFKKHRLMEAIRNGDRLTAVRVKNRESGKIREFRAQVFVDGTYEGDLAAFAGAAYRLGRESRTEFNEPHAGVIYMDHSSRKFLPGTTGEGDDRLPAFTYRLCLTNQPENSVPVAMPEGYDRNRYTNYFLDLKLGRLDTIVKALSIAPIPNGKFDANMKPWPLGFPFAEENIGYIEADWDEREAMEAHLRNLTLGLVYFLQNDPEIADEQRNDALQYGLPKDEFLDTGHFPWALYVREGRRIVGEYTLTENDVTYGPGMMRAPIHRDAVATGEFPIDAFPTRKYEPGHEAALEGYILMLGEYTKPYQIPYGCMVPEKVNGLIAPVPVSATHIAFSTVRLEPTWLSLGQAAGIAADLAIRGETEIRDVSIDALQAKLIAEGQVLSYFSDIDAASPYWSAVQRLGTEGFFDSYLARLDAPLTNHDAILWLNRLVEHSPIAEAISSVPHTYESATVRLRALNLLDPVSIEEDAACSPSQWKAWMDRLLHVTGWTATPPPMDASPATLSRGAACMSIDTLLFGDH